VSLTTLNAYQQGGPVLDKLKQLWGYQEGGPIGPTRREFIKRILSGIGGLWASKNLPGVGEEVVPELPPVIPQLSWYNEPEFWLGPEQWMNPQTGNYFRNPIQHGGIKILESGDEYIDLEKYVGEIRPFWRKGGVEGAPNIDLTSISRLDDTPLIDPKGVPGGGFRHFMARADEMLGPYAPEMTAHGVTYPDMRKALLREGAKLSPGDVIDPQGLLDNIDYYSKINATRGTVEAYRQGLKEVEKGDHTSVFPSKEEHLAHYQKKLAEEEEKLSRLLHKKSGIKGLTLSDHDLYHSGKFPGMLDSPVYDAPIPSGAWMGRAGRGLLMGLGALGGTAIDLAASPTPTGSGELPWLNPPTEYDLGYLGDLQGGADLSPILNELRAGTPVERPMSSRDWERRRTSEAFNRQLRGN